SYALYGRTGKQRFSIYVPEELAADVERAIQNGRSLQKLISEAGRRYAVALKKERRSSRGRRWSAYKRGLLNEDEFGAWCKRLELTAKSSEVIADVRSRPPARRVGGG